MFSELLTIMAGDAAANDVQGQIIRNSMTNRLLQKQSSAKIAEIHAKYDVEKEQIRNEINGLDDDSSSNEYQDLMTELNELKSEEEREVEAEENAVNDRETGIQLENENLEVRLEAIKTNNEAFKECHQQNIEQSFGYFQ